MASTFSQIYLQIVFAVKGRENLLQQEWKKDVHKYIAGIITNKGQKPIIVNGTADHVHVFVGIKPSMRPSDLVRDIKANSSKFINEQFLAGCFSWQEGYGIFSYSQSQVKNVYNYILNQEIHHQKQTFKEEYFDFLEKFDIPYEERFLFEWIE